jgi:hypothetical protein
MVLYWKINEARRSRPWASAVTTVQCMANGNWTVKFALWAYESLVWVIVSKRNNFADKTVMTVHKTVYHLEELHLFGDITSCSLSKVNWQLSACFVLVCCLAYSATLKMEATFFSEMSVDFQGITWCFTAEDGTLHNHCFENRKSYTVYRLMNLRFL